MNAPADSHLAPHDPYASLRIANFRRFLGSSVLANVGMQMQSIAVLWEIFDRTQSSSAIGAVGLVQVLPVVVLAIAAGHVADRFPRQWVIAVSMALAGLGSLALLAVSLLKLPIEHDVWQFVSHRDRQGVSSAGQVGAFAAGGATRSCFPAP